MPSPLVSIVIPTYNRRAYIGETVDSVLSQSYSKIEIIVVDDGSSDGTGELVKERFRSNRRVRYIWQENAERSAARNRGLRASRGEFVAFLDSDDLWMPEKLEKQLSAFRSHPQAGCCYTLFGWFSKDASQFVTTDSLPPDGYVFESLLCNCFIGSMTPLVRRECFEDIGGFWENPGIIGFEDWEMWTRLALKYTWILVPEVLGLYRMHDMNSQRPADLQVDQLRIQKMMSYPSTSAQRTTVFRYAANRRWHWATKLWSEGDRSVVPRLLISMLWIRPSWGFNLHLWSLLVRSICAMRI